ncbi:MAG TPA: hypothetical protein PK611_08915, partial [Saprospiraceae bacterium]|nr:hypothetical protein [Saprospiraceae bacterium]
GSWSANPSTTISGCHSVRARYVLAAACGSTPAGASSSDPGCAASAAVNALIYPEAPVITAPANTCTSAFTLPVVTPYAGFTVQYRIQNVPNSILIDWTSTPVMPTTPGCYTIQARYVNTAQCGSIAPLTPGTGSCGSSNVVNTVIFPAAPVISFNSGIPDADIQRCPGTGLLFIIFPPYPPGAFGNWYEFELQYRWNGVWSTPGTIVGGIPDWFAVGCKEIVTRYV